MWMQISSSNLFAVCFAIHCLVVHQTNGNCGMFIPETGKSASLPRRYPVFWPQLVIPFCGDNDVRTLIQPEKIRLVAPALSFLSLLLLPTGSLFRSPRFYPTSWKSKSKNVARNSPTSQRRTEIGANSYYLEIGDGASFSIAGCIRKMRAMMHSPNLQADRRPRPLDAILVSHSHHDHLGIAGVLRRQPNARVFMPQATGHRLSPLHNSVSVMTRQREELGTTLPYPLFYPSKPNAPPTYGGPVRCGSGLSTRGRRASTRATETGARVHL